MRRVVAPGATHGKNGRSGVRPAVPAGARLVEMTGVMNFEQALNERLKTGLLKVHVAIVPLGRDALQSALLEGRVDLVIAQVHLETGS